MVTAQQLHDRLKASKIGGSACTYTLERCEALVPMVNAVNELKKRKNAVILAHSYVNPDIVYGVADFVGDSYGLSKDASRTRADTIIFAAVRFMGETAKILNPGKEVLLPATDPGCTLADSITGEQVRVLRARHPDHTFVCYINTTAEVKAECDVCVTSSNVYRIVEALPGDKIYFLPDRLMGLNLREEMRRRGVDKEILVHDGVCYVHEQYDPEMIRFLRAKFEDLKVVSHPECSPAVLRQSDYVGSTNQMLEFVAGSKGRNFLMLTECGLTSRLEVELPGKNFVGSCTTCRYMKSNSLQQILRLLVNPEPKDRIEIEERVRVRAQKCIDAMFRYAGEPVPVPGSCD